MNDLVAVDGNSVAYRHMITAKPASGWQHAHPHPGVVAGAFMDLCRQLIERWHARRIVIAWDDPSGSNRRRRIFPEYKQSRRDKRDVPDEVAFRAVYYEQLRSARALLWGLGIDQVRAHEMEGDDLVAQLVRQAQGRRLVVTTDRDLWQLVTKDVSVLDPYTPRVVSVGNFESLAGVPLEVYLEFKALQGDASDDVPGIRGVGPKTAAAWLRQAPIAEEIVRVVTKPPRALQTLRDNLDVVRRNRSLFDLCGEFGPPMRVTLGRWLPDDTRMVLERLSLRTMLAEWGSYYPVFDLYARAHTAQREENHAVPATHVGRSV